MTLPNNYQEPRMDHFNNIPQNEWSPTPTVNPNKLDKAPNKFSGSEHVDIEGGLETKKKRKRLENKNCCIRCMCCACCLPVWATWVLWILIISILIVVIVIGSIAATFVMPTVSLNGVNSTYSTNTKPVAFTGYSIQLNFGLLVNVNNPNLLDIRLSEMNATAYYPLDGVDEQVGKGYLSSQYVPKYSNINFTFPFALEYDPSVNSDLTVINELINKCGLTGEPKRPITIDYTIKLAAKVLFITVHPTISSTATFECPLDNDSMTGFNEGALAYL